MKNAEFLDVVFILMTVKSGDLSINFFITSGPVLVLNELLFFGSDKFLRRSHFVQLNLLKKL